MEETMTATEAAAYLGVSAQRLFSLTSRGKLKTTDGGFKKDDLDAYRSRRPVKPQPTGEALTPEQTRIVGYLGFVGDKGANRSDLHRLFSNNRTGAVLTADMEWLYDEGKAVEHDGRWYAIGSAPAPQMTWEKCVEAIEAALPANRAGDATAEERILAALMRLVEISNGRGVA